MTRFRDRRTAGAELATRLAHLRDGPRGVVLGLPRGGVPVAFEVARTLGWPLDVFVVRKLGAPGHEEYAIGAIASGGVRVVNEAEVRLLGVPDPVLRDIEAREQRELERRERAYRATRPPLDLTGRVAVLVDDGLATGASMRAAVEAARRLSPARLVVAVPVGAPDTCRALARVADEVVCASRPDPFVAVGVWYDDFRQTTDAEVHDLLAQAPTHEEGSQ